MPGVEFILHKGKKILYHDFTGSNPRTLRETLDRAREMIDKEPPDSVLSLVNVTDVQISLDGVMAMTNFVNENTPKIRKAAIIGIDPLKKEVLQRIVTETHRDNLMVFDDIESAKDYLAGP